MNDEDISGEEYVQPCNANRCVLKLIYIPDAQFDTLHKRFILISSPQA